MLAIMIMDPFTMDMPVDYVMDKTGGLIYRPGAVVKQVYNTPPPWTSALPPQIQAPTVATLAAHTVKEEAAEDDHSVRETHCTSDSNEISCSVSDHLHNANDSIVTDSSSSRTGTMSSARSGICSSSECGDSTTDPVVPPESIVTPVTCAPVIKGEELYGTTYRFSKPIHLIQQVRELHDMILRELVSTETAAYCEVDFVLEQCKESRDHMNCVIEELRCTNKDLRDGILEERMNRHTSPIEFGVQGDDLDMDAAWLWYYTTHFDKYVTIIPTGDHVQWMYSKHCEAC